MGFVEVGLLHQELTLRQKMEDQISGLHLNLPMEANNMLSNQVTRKDDNCFQNRKRRRLEKTKKHPLERIR